MLNRLGDRAILVLALSPAAIFILVAFVLILGPRLTANPSQTQTAQATASAATTAPTAILPTATPTLVPTVIQTVAPTVVTTSTPKPGSIIIRLRSDDHANCCYL